MLCCKLDLADAFKRILVRSQDWPAMGSSLVLQLPDSTIVHLYCIDFSLPFWLHSPLALFNEYTNTLQCAMYVNWVEDVLHYLGAYFTFVPQDMPVCANNIKTMVATCMELGFAVNPKKVTQPSTMISFLRIYINSVNQQVSLDPELLKDTASELKDISKARSATKHTILCLVGKLHFVCHICRPSFTTW